MSDFAVAGSPIEHSLSPVLHQAAFRAQGLDHSYSKFEVGDLSTFSKLQTLQGISLTMPLKQQAFDLATSHDAASTKTRACNTLVQDGSQWLGFNTDVFGLQMALAESDRSMVLVLGSGATAFSAVAALDPAESVVAIRARNPATRAQLETFASGLGFSTQAAEAISATLVIATTDPADHETPSGVELFDAVYASDNQRFRKHLGPKISGLEMLLWQALAQQRLFITGQSEQELPGEQQVIDAMRQALNQAVGE